MVNEDPNVEVGFCNYCLKSQQVIMRISFSRGQLKAGHGICDDCLFEILEDENQIVIEESLDCDEVWCDICNDYVEDCFIEFYPNSRDIMECYECTEIE